MPAEPDSPPPPTAVPRPAPDGGGQSQNGPPAAGAREPLVQSKIENPKSKIQRLLAYRLLLLLALAILTLDQASKHWLTQHLPFGVFPGSPEAAAIVPGFFYLVHVGNTGAAWSLFTGQSMALAALAVATLAAIGFWRRSLGLRQPAVQVAFGLLCGGIVGNLLDRLRHGHVTDFLDLHFGSYIYPTFNIADSGICVGTLIYVIHSLRSPS